MLDLSRTLTVRVGGTAGEVHDPASLDELVATLDRLRARGRSPRLLGGGSNIVALEGVLAEPVVRTGALRGITRLTDTLWAVEAGAQLGRIVHESARRGLTGLECCAGVPGTVGAAIRINAGGKWGTIGAVLREVTLLAPNGTRVTRDVSPADFVYRKSPFWDDVVLSAKVELAPAPTTQPARPLDHRDDGTKTTRHEPPSGRLVFATLARAAGGTLINQAGPKGTRVGGRSSAGARQLRERRRDRTRLPRLIGRATACATPASRQARGRDLELNAPKDSSFASPSGRARAMRPRCDATDAVVHSAVGTLRREIPRPLDTGGRDAREGRAPGTCFVERRSTLLVPAASCLYSELARRHTASSRVAKRAKGESRRCVAWYRPRDRDGPGVGSSSASTLGAIPRHARLDAAGQRARACPVKMGGGNLSCSSSCARADRDARDRTGVAAGWSTFALLLGGVAARWPSRQRRHAPSAPQRRSLRRCVVPAVAGEVVLLAWPIGRGCRARGDCPRSTSATTTATSRSGAGVGHPRLWAALRRGGLFVRRHRRRRGLP